MRHPRCVLVAALLALVATVPARGEKPVIEVGQPFPLLVLPDVDGDARHSVAEFRGRRLMLHVFASW